MTAGKGNLPLFSMMEIVQFFTGKQNFKTTETRRGKFFKHDLSLEKFSWWGILLPPRGIVSASSLLCTVSV